LVVAAVAWGVVVSLMLLSASGKSRDALDELRAAQNERTFSALVDPATAARMHDAADGFSDADSAFGSPVVAPAKFLPIVGRQIRAADSLNGAAADTADLAADAADELREATTGPTPVGAERVALIQQLNDLVGRTSAGLKDIDPDRPEALVGPLDEAFDKFTESRSDGLEGLHNAEAVLDGAVQLLDGQSRYLLLGANNAEMRAGSGMFLSAGTLEINAGSLHMGDVESTGEKILDPPVAVDGELATNFPWLAPGRDFRNLALSPSFPQTAALAQRMWAVAPGGGPVDGVLAIDVDGLQAMLGVVGPVEVDGVMYDHDNVRFQLLNGQYKRFNGRTDERREVLGDVARAVFDRLEGGGWKVDELATALVDATQGRHLLLWSSVEAEQKAWSTAGVDGQLDDDSLAVSVLNRGANKLDFFLESAVDVETAPGADGGTDVSVTVVLTNKTPAGEPRYVAGPGVDGVAEGEYSGIVEVNVPGAATDVSFTGGQYSTLSGVDGPTIVSGQYVRIVRDASATLVLTFHLPAGMTSMSVEPTARVPVTQWRHNDVAFTSDRRRTLEW
jgi:hypothetical protein